MKLFICTYCSKQYNKSGSLKNHTLRCPLNKDRKIQQGGGGWNKGLTKESDPRIGHSEETRYKIKISNTKREWSGHTDDFKMKQRQNALKNKLGGVRPSRWIKYKGETLGSSYELEVVKSLDQNGIKWETCSRFDYIDPKGKKRTYTPDIFLPEFDIYLDPKNDFLINNINPSLGFSDKEKIHLVEIQNNIRVIILNKDNLSWNKIKLLL